MPPSRRSRTSPGTAEPGVARADAHAEGPPVLDDASEPGDPTSEPQSSAEPQKNTLTVRLPLVTLSLSRPAGRPGAAPSTASGRELPVPRPIPSSGSGQRLLFYTGMAALGVAGIVEWPVAAAIAAGTYLAGRTRATTSHPTVPAERPKEASPGGT